MANFYPRGNESRRAAHERAAKADREINNFLNEREQRIVLRNAYAKKKEQIQKAGAETELVYMKASKELLQKKK